MFLLIQVLFYVERVASCGSTCWSYDQNSDVRFKDPIIFSCRLLRLRLALQWWRHW